mgnify:CR=1 FL=1
MPFALNDVRDEEFNTQPLRWGFNAVAYGNFSATEGLVWVDAVPATVVAWSHTDITFVPEQNGRQDGFYNIHVDCVDEPIIPEFIEHPTNLTLDETPFTLIATHIVQQSEIEEGTILVDQFLDSHHIQQQSEIQESEYSQAHNLLSLSIEQRGYIKESTVTLETNLDSEDLIQQSVVQESDITQEHNVLSETLVQQSGVEEGAVDQITSPFNFTNTPDDLLLAPTITEHNLTVLNVSQQGAIEEGAITQDSPFNFTNAPDDLLLASTSQYLHNFTTKDIGEWT